MFVKLCVMWTCLTAPIGAAVSALSGDAIWMVINVVALGSALMLMSMIERAETRHRSGLCK